MIRIVLLLLFQIVFIISLFGKDDGGKTIASSQVETKNELASIYKVIDNSLNSLYDSANIWWTSQYMVSDSILNTPYPLYPPYIYEQRINYLNELSPIKFNYNQHVQVYIEAYGLRNRDKMQLVMSKSMYYFPIFEEYLSKYGLPLELKYLAAVESALDPNAISKSGAVGLWQFMKPTADLFDLKLTSYIDERRDVFKSTDAACRYLKYLFNTFGDWQLALAAYNGGPGTVKKAIARSGGKTNYWELRPYLSNEMQNYV
ncbi:MAG: lytic transglycosylase domain-containing protein, partial [Bacteroidales bacterium]|nr:lytic transglycosylase domain-containing protein [Bacteroidales bacterium]